MIRIVKLTGKYYGYEFNNLDNSDERENIQGFVDEGTPVILVDSLDDLESLDLIIGKDEIVMV